MSAPAGASPDPIQAEVARIARLTLIEVCAAFVAGVCLGGGAVYLLGVA